MLLIVCIAVLNKYDYVLTYCILINNNYNIYLGSHDVGKYLNQNHDHLSLKLRYKDYKQYYNSRLVGNYLLKCIIFFTDFRGPL